MILNLTGLRRPANKCTSPINRVHFGFPRLKVLSVSFWHPHDWDTFLFFQCQSARNISAHFNHLFLLKSERFKYPRAVQWLRLTHIHIYLLVWLRETSLSVKCSSWSLSWASVAANSMSQPLQNVDSVMHPAQDIGKYSTSRTILHKTQSDHGHIFYY